jgi:excisionase family DNA binding protein
MTADIVLYPGHLHDQEGSPPLTTDELAFGFAAVLLDELAKRDVAIAALEAALPKREDPDLDGRLNVKRAAERLACSYETVRRRCAQGRLDASKDRGQWKIRL